MSDILQVKNITKTFPGVRALDNVSVQFRKGEVHALSGINGSGKSTLLKIITGVLPPDSGELIFEGRPVSVRNVSDSRNLGISLVYQELSLVPCLTVAENIWMGRLPMKNGFLQRGEMNRRAEKLIEKLGIPISARAFVEDLSMAEKQMVEIAKALSVNGKLLLLDEPSAVLTQKELDKLFGFINHLKASGVTVVYISHRLEEIFEIADRVTVLRDGVKIGTADIDQIGQPDLIRMMIGGPLDDIFPPLQGDGSQQKVLEIKNLRTPKISNIHIKLYEREIIGVYGVVGSGQKELVDALFGIHTEELYYDSFEVCGHPVRIKNPYGAIQNGLAYIPEERKLEGLMLGMNIRENTSITFLDRLRTRWGGISPAKERSTVRDLCESLSVKAPTMETTMESLSGGNQQKVVIAKWLGKNAKILVCFEPTRGIDVNAKAQVYQALENIRRNGSSVIIISSEISEILGMCERAYVMGNGKFTAMFTREEMDSETMLSRAIGMGV